uniref:Uncharacterized protein n=1 Tax=Arundo donax TaxID=35708 RepID=A0A0A9EH63_ARUDO
MSNGTASLIKMHGNRYFVKNYLIKMHGSTYTS